MQTVCLAKTTQSCMQVMHTTLFINTSFNRYSRCATVRTTTAPVHPSTNQRLDCARRTFAQISPNLPTVQGKHAYNCCIGRTTVCTTCRNYFSIKYTQARTNGWIVHDARSLDFRLIRLIYNPQTIYPHNSR